MPSRSFDYCALQFLNQWLEKESALCDSLASDSPEEQRRALVRAGVHFRIARNLPTKYEMKQKVDRYQPVINILKSISDISSSDIESVVSNTEKKISHMYGERNVLSFTSKVLWLNFKSPIRIYDSQARRALGTRQDDYDSFNAEFTARFEKSAEEIEQACENLKKAISYTVKPTMTDFEIDSIVNQLWFKERVFDAYLWNKGNSV